MTTINKENVYSTKNRNLGIYVHIPFCQRKCSYCGFLSLVNQPKTAIKQYMDNLLLEVDLHFADLSKGDDISNEEQFSIDTIYIGGGTPSLIDGKEISSLLDKIRQKASVSCDAEITMESNPNSLTMENLMAYRVAGVNRLSIGVQSFDDNILRDIGRLHDSQAAVHAVSMAKNAGFDNINLDLLFGLPGQTLSSWKESLEKAVSLQQSHLSLYTLQIEEGTSLYKDYKADKLPLIDLSVDRASYHYAIDYLSKNGYAQYEISNFAKAGYECRHNLKYWSMDNFLGIGLNSSSFIDGKRWRNLSEMDQWNSCVEHRIAPIDKNSVEVDTASDAMGIFLFTGLRKTSGISLEEFSKRFGVDFFRKYSNIKNQLDEYREKGYLVWSDTGSGRLWLTESGIDHSNEIMSEFV